VMKFQQLVLRTNWLCLLTDWRKSYRKVHKEVRRNVGKFQFKVSLIILCSVDRASRYMRVMKPTWCTIYLQFIQSLYLYMFRAPGPSTVD
jgi:hypothetical protein